jgi:2-iminobutanoate/2-iminopropanoate deaminase
MLTIISTEAAPRAIGPYSQAVKANGFIFLSGQIPLDPASGQLVTGSTGEQTRQVLVNLSNVLKSAGCDMSNVVKTTVFLKDMKDFDQMNAVYGEFFAASKPARATVQVAALPKNVDVEIEAIAVAP